MGVLSRRRRSFPLLSLILLLTIPLIAGASGNEDIKDYKVCYGAAGLNGRPLLVLRQFQKAGIIFYLTADVNSLKTAIVSRAQLIPRQMTWAQLQQLYKETPYMKALHLAADNARALHDAGITHGSSAEKGITLTVDLCPSHHPLDRSIFTSLIAGFKQCERPVPVALSITGRFMERHQNDINWLNNLVKSGDIAITWVNHTYNHHFDPRAPIQSNFILAPGTDLRQEVIRTEVAMLERGLLPSVFFRFPGLVSDQKVTNELLSYGLIPVGSDAWLAKGQIARAGSIVLIHGNGNEPVGVKEFTALLEKEKRAIQRRQWLMYGLSESVGEEFKQ